MFLQCLLFLVIFAQIEAQFGVPNPRVCPYPRFDHGRFRMRQKSKLIKFICYPGYELVGNKYATCRDGEWDVPLPVCVKPGCKLPPVENGVTVPSRKGAWLVFFCLPGHKLVGSSAMYCDGRKWNSTIPPSCVDSTSASSLGCSFEDPSLCGWTHDDLHDFDWLRLNKKTPSSFLFTGPSHDHTFGEAGSGYYMYIESTSRLENDTARLLSPIYDVSLAKNGCFSFYYHMFGKTTGGLRVYQKPDNIALHTMLQGTDREQYLLFERWGNQGDAWYRGVEMLRDFSDNFQIVIEGIRGTSFTSDIAIDDVAILQGDNCTAAIKTATTPAITMPDTCSGRCNIFGVPFTELGCGCTAACVTDNNCCPDFFEICVFGGSTTPEDDFPQTQKLVASSTVSTTSPPTTIATPKTTTSTTTKPTTSTTTKSTTSTTTKPPKTTKITTKQPATTKRPRVPTTIKTKVAITTTLPPKTTKVTTRKVVTLLTTTAAATNDKLKQKKEQIMEAVTAEQHNQKAPVKEDGVKSKSSGLKTAIITITALLGCAALLWLAVQARGARGRIALSRLRGQAQRDPEVRYLNADVDD